MGEFAFQTLRESITSAIRSKILTGELQPGVKLAEQKLAEEFGSSRAPIREALRQLEQEGMVEYSRNVGCSVRRVKPEDAYEIYLLRAFDWAGLAALAIFTYKVPGSRGAFGGMAVLFALFFVQRFLPRLLPTMPRPTP